MLKARSSWQVTRAVWYAMFMREFVTRTMADRMAWFWMLFEPMAVVGLMVAIRTLVLGRERLIMNAEFIPWLVIGLMGFYLFRDNMMRLMGAVEANKALFAYRQVKPSDPVFVRSFVETSLRSVVFLVFIVVITFLGINMNPDSPLLALWAWTSLWALGFGVGLTLSALSILVPEVAKIARIMSLPLLIISGVIFPISFVPHHLLPYFLINPIPHGLEVLRQGFYIRYPLVEGVSLLYLWYWALGALIIGLLLHIRFENKLKAQ